MLDLTILSAKGQIWALYEGFARTNPFAVSWENIRLGERISRHFEVVAWRASMVTRLKPPSGTRLSTLEMTPVLGGMASAQLPAGHIMWQGSWRGRIPNPHSREVVEVKETGG